jgi:enoyl-CoA hydratase/carnithine racemase
MADDITVERTDSGVAVVRFAVGDRNAVREQSLTELCAALDGTIDDSTVTAIVLAAAGRHFVAGADFGWLDGLTAMPPSLVRSQIYRSFKGAAERLYRCPKPTVAAVQGAAITVGCELAIACDFRLVSERATFQESWIRLGLMPPLGGLFLLPRMVGVARATEMVLQGRPIDAKEAVAIGLANELVPEAELNERAHRLAEGLAALPPLAYAAIKDGLHRGMESSMDREWAANVTTQSMLIDTDDFAEGLAALRERRPPSFRGI